MNQTVKSAEELPGSFGIPFLGETLELFTQQEQFYWKRFQLYRTHFKTQIMGRKIACLIGPDANQFVLKDRAENFSSKVGWSILEPLFGEGILLQDGQKHQMIRKLMYPAFHPQAIASYFDIIQSTVEEFLDSWTERNPIFLIDELRQLALLIACRLLLGTKAEQEVKILSQYFSELIAGIRTVLRWDIPLTKFGRAMNARRQLEVFLYSIIEQRRKQENFSEAQNVLGLLLSSTDEDGNQLNDLEIITQSLQLLFGGHETTAKLLCWSLFQISSHSEWKEQLQEEQTGVLGSQPLTFSDLKQFTLMGYILKEVERLYPSIYTIPRGVIQDVEYAGYLIPQDWYVIVSPLLTHRLSEFYSEPHDFNPNRFLLTHEENKPHPFALIGFGGGVHRCLGSELAQMEMKVFLSTLLRRYRWGMISNNLVATPICQTSKEERKMRLWLEKCDSIRSKT
ncbi:cytochrome P450 [Aphanothece hegewaldii CCALA 016]|uniref:Cytochrome P450 n=1 Tax=Aphanothece hegewaldii CCALA 016 TaxID=2107694 RepID=A0A2T1LSY2_9CHRO|nr:cytochrome P450 [Aphanothece hegewaldii]PSF33316.1 cytochrome P450 [Aphanothece hegewaldii CCALA 016]